LVILSFLRYRTRKVSELWEEGGIDDQIIFKVVVWVVLGLIVVALAMRGKVDWRLLRRGPMRWYAAYALLAAASMLYSVAPGLTAFRAAQLFVSIGLVMSLRDKLWRLDRLAVLYVALNWVLVVASVTGLHGGIDWIRQSTQYDPELGDRVWRFSSALGHPMSIAFVAAVGAIWLYVQTSGVKWLKNGPVIALLVLTVVLSISRTAIAGLAAGWLIVAVGRRSVVQILLLFGTAVPLVLLVSTSTLDRSLEYLSRGQSGEELETLSRRTLIYREVLDRGAHHLLLGEGFRSSRRMDLSDAVGQIVHAHNLILEGLLGLGVLGVGLLVGVLATYGSRLILTFRRRRVQTPWGTLTGMDTLGLSMPLFAFCALTPGFAGEVSPVMLISLVMIALVDSIASGYLEPDPGRSEAPGRNKQRAS
jgi:hypothetical protein